MTPSQVLQEARLLIEAGWTQGWYLHVRTDGVDYCILGAMNQVYSRPDCQEAAFEAAFDALTRSLPPGFECVDDLNDHDRTTKRRVLALFDRALTSVTK